MHQRLLRILGVAFGIAATLGGTLGVGIMRTPGLVAAQSGSIWIAMAMWLGGGIFALFATVSIAELAVMIPRSGGFYNYAKAAWGNTAGVVVGCIDSLCQISAVAYGAVTASDLLTKLGWNFRGSSVCLILLLAGIQWMGIRSASKIQQVVSFLLAIVYVGMAAAAMIMPVQTISVVAPTAAASMAAMVIAVRAMIVTYDGWYGPIYFAEEVRHPDRDLPRSMIEGVAIVTCVYLAINAGLFAVLGLGGVAESSFPAIDAAKRLAGEAGERTITMVSLLAMPSLMNTVLLFATRVIYAMGRDGLMPRATAEVSRRGTPEVALLIATAASIALAMTGTFESLLELAGFLFASVYCSGFIALIALRRKMPDAARPFRVWFYPWATLSVLIPCLVFLGSDLIAKVFR